MLKNKTYLLNEDGRMISLFDLEPFRDPLVYKFPHATLSYDSAAKVLKVTSDTSLIETNEIELGEVMEEGLEETTALSSSIELGLNEYVDEEWSVDIACWIKRSGHAATVIFMW